MKSVIPFCCVAILLLTASCHKEKKALVYDNGPTDSLKINEVQFIASHNSYHLKTDSGIFSGWPRLLSWAYFPLLMILPV